MFSKENSSDMCDTSGDFGFQSVKKRALSGLIFILDLKVKTLLTSLLERQQNNATSLSQSVVSSGFWQS